MTREEPDNIAVVLSQQLEQRLVALQGKQLDHQWVRGWIVDMLGEDDVRVTEWDRIVRIHGYREEE